LADSGAFPDRPSTPTAPLFAVFVCPLLSENASRMIEAAASLPGVQVGVVSQDPQEHAPHWARRSMAAHWRIDSILDPAQIVTAVRGLSTMTGFRVSRLYGAYEQAQQSIAEARETLGIPGMSSDATRNFRDKSRMKDVLRAAGLPCARHRLARSADEALGGAAAIGYPIVVKPPAGAGSVATFRVEGEDELRTVLAYAPPSAGSPALLEEFIVGEEHSLETISVAGRPVWHSLTHYAPTPLDVVRNPWIQWCVLLPREVDDARYDDIKRAAAGALDALGMETGLSHMEWFRRSDGSVAIGEVGARPPGAQITTLISRANDIDFLAAWARVMIFGEFTVPERKFAVGAAFLRGQGDGRVRSVRGLETVARELGGLVCDYRSPQEGDTPTGTYEGEGFIIVRHPETRVVERALARIVSLIRVELG
jgi:biotin carboxylase